MLHNSLAIFMCMGRTDFDFTMGWLQNQGYFQGFFLYTQTIVFPYKAKYFHI